MGTEECQCGAASWWTDIRKHWSGLTSLWFSPSTILLNPLLSNIEKALIDVKSLLQQGSVKMSHCVRGRVHQQHVHCASCSRQMISICEAFARLLFYCTLIFLIAAVNHPMPQIICWSDLSLIQVDSASIANKSSAQNWKERNIWNREGEGKLKRREWLREEKQGRENPGKPGA